MKTPDGNSADKRHLLIYGPSLWGFLDSIAEGPKKLWPPDKADAGKEAINDP